MARWKNKHVIIATLMAPVLAVIAYFGVNHMVGEKPHVAEAGQSYQLVEKPNCRYASGTCGLKNADFELTLHFELLEGDRMLLKLASVYALDGVLVALAESDTDDKPPVAMQPADPTGLEWSFTMARPDAEKHRLRLVASAGGANYFGDAALKFTLAQPGKL
jgi:hypothetical protein